MRLLPMGAMAVLVEGLGDDPAAWSEAVRSLGLAGVIDVVPAARTVLIRCESRAALAAVAERLHEVPDLGARDREQRPTISVPLRYDGPDLDEVAALTGRSVDEVVSLHAAARYEVAFCGFAPGFGYLRGLPRELQLPRRRTPRTRVPAGSVAIAAEYSAVYPTDSPGGWHLLGSTDVVLFDASREPPALLSPGSVVRFEPT
jgi:KipI family sensor histidine kinase inhibitor